MKKLAMVLLAFGALAFQMIRLQLNAEDQTAKPAISVDGAVLIPSEIKNETGLIPANTESLTTLIPPNAEGVTVITGGVELIVENVPQRTEAVVDIRHLFKHAKPFERDREKLRAEVAESNQRMERMLQELKSLREEYKSAEKGSVNNDQIVLAQRVILKDKEKQIEAEHSASASMILGKETEMHLAMYEQVVAEVAAYAKEQGIRVVRRKEPVGYGIHVSGYAAVTKTEDVTVIAKNGSPVNVPKKVVSIVRPTGKIIKEEQPATSSQLLQKLMEKEVIYSEPDQENDITEEILNRLNAKFEAEAAAK